VSDVSNDALAIENAKLRTRVAALEQVLAPLMVLDVDHQLRLSSPACWANCARCRLTSAKIAFSQLGGTGGGR